MNYWLKLWENIISLNKAEFYLTCLGTKWAQSELTAISEQHHPLGISCTWENKLALLGSREPYSKTSFCLDSIFSQLSFHFSNLQPDQTWDSPWDELDSIHWLFQQNL